MRTQSPWTAVVGGAAITGLIIALSSAVLHTRWVMPPLVLAGTIAIVLWLWRIWHTGPRRGELSPALQRLGKREGVVALGTLIAGEAAFGFVFVYAIATAAEHPCI